jgi:hypothetical protein
MHAFMHNCMQAKQPMLLAAGKPRVYPAVSIASMLHSPTLDGMRTG